MLRTRLTAMSSLSRVTGDYVSARASAPAPGPAAWAQPVLPVLPIGPKVDKGAERAAARAARVPADPYARPAVPAKKGGRTESEQARDAAAARPVLHMSDLGTADGRDRMGEQLRKDGYVVVDVSDMLERLRDEGLDFDSTMAELACYRTAEEARAAHLAQLQERIEVCTRLREMCASGLAIEPDDAYEFELLLEHARKHVPGFGAATLETALDDVLARANKGLASAATESKKINTLIAAAETRRAAAMQLEDMWNPAQTGFGTLNAPCSLHNPYVRRLRVLYDAAIARPAAAALGMPYVQTVIDRMLYRTPGMAPTAETWHRDEPASGPPRGHTPGAPYVQAIADSVTFGGWINMDRSEAQYFSCVPGTQRDLVGVHASGFAKIPVEEHNVYKARSVRVTIPPGHAFVFNETLVHEVLSISRKTRQRRVFTGFCASAEQVDMIVYLDGALDDQGMLPLKSGQAMRMYPLMPGPGKFARLAAWSAEHLRAACLVDHAVRKTDSDEFGVWRTTPVVMPSLRALQDASADAPPRERVRMYAPYSDEERAVLHAHPHGVEA